MGTGPLRSIKAAEDKKKQGNDKLLHLHLRMFGDHGFWGSFSRIVNPAVTPHFFRA